MNPMMLGKLYKNPFLPQQPETAPPVAPQAMHGMGTNPFMSQPDADANNTMKTPWWQGDKFKQAALYGGLGLLAGGRMF